MPEGQQPPVQDESLDDIKRKYAESSNEGKRLAARVRQLEEEKRQMELRAAPPQADPDEAALEEAGLDTGALRRFLARENAVNTQQNLQPLFNAYQAQQEIPVELQPKVQTFLASNPDVQDAYNTLLAAGKTKQAAAFATGFVRMHDAEAGMHQENDAAKAKREAERRDGALPASASGRGTSDESEAEQAAERRQKLREAGQAMGGFNKALASEFFRGKIKVVHNLTDGPTTI